VSASVSVYAVLSKSEPATAASSVRDAGTQATGNDGKKATGQQRKIGLAFDGLELSGSGEQAELLCEGVNQAILAALANRGPVAPHRQRYSRHAGRGNNASRRHALPGRNV